MAKRNPVIRVAHVRYSPNGKIYSARCERRDIQRGSLVEVLFDGATYQDAEVVAVSFQRWQCKDVVLNLKNEVEYHMNSDGTMNRVVRRRPEFEVNDAGEMLQIYEAAAGEDEQDAYLGDGVWITSTGVLKDRGR